MINKIYNKYHQIVCKRETSRLKAKGRKHSHLFQPKGNINFSDFTSTLKEMGVTSSDTLLIRLSSQAMPYLDGGLLGFYNNLFDYVDSGKGNVMSLSYSFDRSPLMYLAMDPTFNAEGTPTTIGMCSEIFRRMPGVIRSIHPTHSVSVYGADKKEIAGAHHCDPNAYSEMSPFGHLYKHKPGKEIIIGLNHSSVGQHFIENKTTVTGKISKPILSKVTVDGNVQRLPFYVDNPFVKHINAFQKPPFLHLLKEMNVLKQSYINGISVYVYDSRAFYKKLGPIYNSHMRPFTYEKTKTFILNNFAKPIVLNHFFKSEQGSLVPRKENEKTNL